MEMSSLLNSARMYNSDTTPYRSIKYENGNYDLVLKYIADDLTECVKIYFNYRQCRSSTIQCMLL